MLSKGPGSDMIIAKKAIQMFNDFSSVLLFSLRISFKSSPKYFFIRVLVNIISTIIPFFIVYLSGKLINLLTINELSQNQLNLFALLVLLMFIAKLVSGLANTALVYCDGMHRELITQYNRSDVMKTSSNIDISFYDSPEFYDELSDANSNTYTVSFAAFQTIDLLRSLVQLVVAYVYLSVFNPFYSLILIMSGIPQAVFQIRQLNLIYTWKRDNMTNERKIRYISELAVQKHFAKDVRFYSLTSFLMQKYTSLFNTWFCEKKKMSFKSTVLLSYATILPEVATALLTFNLGVSIVSGTLSMGDFVLYTGIITQLLGSMYMLFHSFSEINDARSKIKNYMRLLNWKTSQEKHGTCPVPAGELMFEFCHVSFSYSDNLPNVLTDLSFSFSSTDKLAIVGQNGSGKTTIIKLLMRFYDPTNGVILLNDRDIRDYDLSSLRRCFSALFQDYCNYAFSVKESTMLADLAIEPDTQKLHKALEDSGAMEFISTFPHGADTFLSRVYNSDGEELSGGQWQKIALSRTFYRNAQMYILDEPSAALDAQSEDELFRNFEVLYKDKGALLISHRLANVVRADSIIVLDGGKITEIGSHRELMLNNGLYSRMFNLQAEKYIEKS